MGRGDGKGILDTARRAKKGEGFSESRGKGMWVAAFAVLFCLQIMTMVYFGGRKTGFHEDEYYSFYSTNRTGGLYEPDREWVDRDTFRNEFVVLQGEGFRYGLVAEVQSWDVHPPFFYFLLHTACSLFPGVFSKWLGIGVNLIAFCLNFGLLSWLGYMAAGGNKRLAWVVTAVHGFNPVIISGVMFIRMYEWLTVFVLLCACLHVWAVKSGSLFPTPDWRSAENPAGGRRNSGCTGRNPAFGRGNKRQAGNSVSKRFLLALMAVNYLGFLTQYYYVIFLIFMAAGFCLWNLSLCVERKACGRGWVLHRELLKGRVLACVKYGCVCGVSLLLAVASYPASLSHIFRGYRGTGAVSEFLDAGNTSERLGFFIGLMDEYLFDGYLWIWLAVIVLMVCAVWIKKKGQEKKRKAGKACSLQEAVMTEGPGRMGGGKDAAVFFLLLFAACGYFFTVSKTALLLYETSNRYQLPVYGILILLVITAVYGLWRHLVYFYCQRGGGERKAKWLEAAGGCLLLFLFLVGDVQEINAGKTIFLYEEEAENVEYAKENADTPVVILYNEATPYHVWWRSQELMEYDRVYFVSEGNKEEITDEIICGSDKVIVYAADYDTQEESLELILQSNPGLREYRLVSRKSLWSVYEFE